MKKLSILMAGAAAMAVLGTTALAQDITSGRLGAIAERGSIVLGHRESSVPFAYLDENQNPVGYSIDLCMAVVAAVEETLGKDLEVQFVPVTPQTRIALMANGTIDLECGSTTNNLTRQEQVEYLPVTFITGTKILTRKDSGIASVDDLDGKTIALAQGTTNERAIKAAVEERGLDVRILPVKDHAEGMLTLETDRVDAYSTDHILLHGLIQKSRTPDDFAVVGDFLSYDPYALMIPRNESDFELVGKRALAALFRSGEIGEIYERWFGPMGVEQSDLLQASFQLNALPE
ncbi:amino acid ABC transporter substrate-binding protein [Halovulum dunhuangense]|uniref:Amino acid ABC transporter substrate-binding protein n=1 Tax=Halovulum dunhuangense TaxID=1505036 RepID=A0A849L763_9RHOB|nr:amino acid ABC transporter substrate-binding protein [Halovulum dunhuangense]NNU81984.1 amino acid ABC transporter substrate-binding protein [Halovulum dunhuangense]